MYNKGLGDRNNDNDKLIDEILEQSGKLARSKQEDDMPEDTEQVAVISSEDFDSSLIDLEESSDEELALYTEESEYELTDEVYVEEEYDEYVDVDYQVTNEEEKIKKPKRKVRKRWKGAELAFALIRITFIVCASVVLSVLLISLGKDYLGIDKTDEAIPITIPEDATTYDIAQILRDEGAIKSPTLFRAISKLKKAGPLYKAGTHMVKPSSGYDGIIEGLTGTPMDDAYDTVSITFKEGINLYEAAQLLLDENVIADIDDFLFYFNSGEFIDEKEHKFYELLADTENSTNYTNKFYKMEGYFFPDTYTFYVGMAKGDAVEDKTAYQLICDKIYDNFEKKISPYYDEIKKSSYTLDELIILASIVQAEAPSKDSMEMVASVFYNRLSNPEAIGRTQAFLESDPTSKYANEVIKPNIDNTASASLKIQAYDTYKVAGLTPGAICNPGIEAIESVLHPAKTEYYYFCANINTKETFYAKTLEEHEANLAMVQQQYAEAEAAAAAAEE